MKQSTFGYQIKFNKLQLAENNCPGQKGSKHHKIPQSHYSSNIALPVTDYQTYVGMLETISR